ncbi:aspartate-alanine antiporter [Shimwellia pseudoproteus]|uniref:aspartate-alanine antiporter n=1 Tax=Shimwellia pseudoproteus TaxID=570012 RepID=UPI0018EC8CCF|nr:aspartate-alanine antiporter [Shimwellia pseudoproteus]MBJ3814163.1 aspartate-alanine antiporter [Shimwellia pseudoproteus]
MEWFVHTLRTYPEIAIFLSIGIGYWVGGKSYHGLSLGAVTATLIAALIIGMVGIQISGTVKSTFFLMFLFAVGYGVGPQFVQGIAKDGLPQALFAVVVCLLCLGFPVLAAKLAGYDLGSAVGLFAGSQTISASMGLATDAIGRLNLTPDKTKALEDAMPVAYAVTYIFGTVGSAVLLAQFGPRLMRINLEEACKDYEAKMGKQGGISDEGTAWHRYILRAYDVAPDSEIVGKTLAELEQRQQSKRIFIQRLRRGNDILEGQPTLTVAAGDVLAIEGRSNDILDLLGQSHREIDDPELLAVPVEGVDVFVSSKTWAGKTLQELASQPFTHGVYLRGIKRGALGNDIPVLPGTTLNRGDVLTLSGMTKDTTRFAKAMGKADRPTNAADVSFIGVAIFIGTIIGAAVLNIDGIPITLSTAGGSLIAGLVFGWLRSVHPTAGRIPQPTLWFMNSVGLNVFIAVVGINAAPGFIEGLRTLGASLFLWGIFATAVPLIISLYIGRYLFHFHPALLFGCVAGARTTTAALGMICESAKSNIPALGYTVTYAVGNTLLTIWSMVVIMLLAH